MIEVGVVGVGGWGKNLARNYFQLAETNLRYVCDLDEDKLAVARPDNPLPVKIKARSPLFFSRPAGESWTRPWDWNWARTITSPSHLI